MDQNPKNILFNYLEQFVKLSSDEKQVLLEIDAFKQFKKGTVLLSEGSYSSLGYFVLKGCIRSYYIVDGVEKTTAFFTEANSFEPPCKVTGKASKIFIDCVEDTILLSASTATEEQILERFPKFQLLCRRLSEQLLSERQVEFDLFKISSPEERYKALLSNRPELLKRVPQHQLASFLGMTPPSLSRIRKRLTVK